MPAKTELTDQEFVENIVKAIVDHPEEVVTGRTLDERGVLIQLTVNREDMGKVIGREGRTAKAIRSLLRVFGARNESRINLKIVDPEGGTGDIPEESATKPAPAKKTESSVPAEKPTETTEKVDDLSAETSVKAEAPVAEMSAEKPIEEKATGVF
ncbi:MAG: KH domain-containing protein [Patescibacteria group bacterium]